MSVASKKGGFKFILDKNETKEDIITEIQWVEKDSSNKKISLKASDTVANEYKISDNVDTVTINDPKINNVIGKPISSLNPNQLDAILPKEFIDKITAP